MSDKYPGGFVTTGAPAGFSVAFDGSGDILTTPASANLALGTGAFTAECWFYTNGNGSDGLITSIDSASGNYAIGIYFSSSTAVTAAIQSNSAAAFGSGGMTFTQNKWNHVALVRDGSGNCAAFMNGIRMATGTTSQNITQNLFNIGRTYTNTGGTYNGYISNARIVKGTAVYDPAQTTLNIPTQLFPITNTQLLVCQSPTIIDNSSNAFAITISGDAKVSNFTPFAGYTGFNPALGAAAGGVWTLDQAAYYQNNRQWPIYDPYFNQTTLMLHGNGANGAQNNTFLDSSSSPLTITRNGNTTQGTFTPFSQTGWSYNGTAGAYCQLNNADYAIGTGDFTIEFWMYCVDDSTYGSSAFAGLPGAGVLTVSMSSGSSNARQPYLEFGGASTPFGTLYGYLNKWTHIAYVRRSGFVTVYQNGVATAAPISKSASFPNSANLYLLRTPGDTAQDFRGYMSNFRITKAAVYSSNFTPSTTPLVPVSNTVLLTFQDNRFVDNSALRATVTPAGTASVQAFSPFVPAYITPMTYSNWFNGTNGYVSIASSANLTLGTGDFTIEAWINPANWTNSRATIIRGGGVVNSPIFAKFDSSNNLGLAQEGVAWIISDATLPSTNTWTHVAVTRSGTTVKIFVNGVQSGSTATSSANFSAPLLTIAASDGSTANGFFTGAISNLRVLKGTALYTSAFTPPTAPLTAITNTSLLTCQSSTFVDNSLSPLTLTASGTAYPVTSPTPFPAKVDTTTLNSAYSTSLIGGSGYFDGTGDYLISAGSVNWSTYTNLTVELWTYPTNLTGSSTTLQAFVGTSHAQNDGYTFIYTYNDGKIAVGINGTNEIVSAAGVIKANTWSHVAVVKVGSTTTIYVNGVSVASNTTGVWSNNSATVYVANTNTQLFTGYLSGVRLVLGSAVYTGAFTPPTTPPAAITNTSLLLNYTNAGIYDSTAKNVLETVGNAQISTTQSKWGGGSMLFDGSGDAVKAPYTPNMDFGTGDFTIECWVYTTNVSPGYSQTVLARQGNTGGVIWIVQILNGGTSRIVLAGSVVCAGTTVAANTWTHLAFTRSGTSLRAFNNGVLITTVTDSTSLSGTQVLTVGAQSDAAESFIGYIDDVRITKGVARYTTNFTPPTSQLQDQ